MDDVNRVIDYYSDFCEDTRLTDSPLEFLRTKVLISRCLKQTPMNILDVGGATGAYSFWLAEMGHRVSLADFTAKHIEIATQKASISGIKLEAATVADARSLPFEDNSFDMVLLMGPLYHLTDSADRHKALSEAARVLRQPGTLICSYISRFASMLDGFFAGMGLDPAFQSIMQTDLTTGVHRNSTDNRMYFTDAYLHHPSEVSPELNAAGFSFEDLFAIESFGSVIPNMCENLKNETYRETLLQIIRLVEKDSSLIGLSNHLLAIAKLR